MAARHLAAQRAELAGRYGVTRTVNRALSVLRTEGLVRPERGRGTTVNELPVIRREAVARQRRDIREAGQARGAFDGELRRLGLTPRSEVEWARSPRPPPSPSCSPSGRARPCWPAAAACTPTTSRCS